MPLPYNLVTALEKSLPSAEFLQETKKNALWKSGILGGIGNPGVMRMIDMDAIPETLEILTSDIAYAAPTIGEVSNIDAPEQDITFGSYKAKVSFLSNWVRLYNIQADLLRVSNPMALIRKHHGNYWATHINKDIGSIMSGLSLSDKITVGADNKNLTTQTINAAYYLKKDMGYDGEVVAVYMNSKTINDILVKIGKGDVPKGIITRRLINQQTNADGTPITYTMGDKQFIHVFMDASPIYVDDDLPDGRIFLLKKGAFVFVAKNIPEGLVYDKNPKGSSGTGTESIGSRILYVLHPTGFDFVGERAGQNAAVSYAKHYGLTPIEYKKAVYTIRDDHIKHSKIIIIKTKMG